MKLRKIIISALCLLVLAGLSVAGAHEYKKWKEDQRAARNTRTLIDLAGIKPEMTFNQKGDALRAFMQANSTHDTSEEFHRIWKDEPLIMEMLAAAARDPKAHKPPLECSTRSAILVRMMKQLGYQAHSVAVYKIDPTPDPKRKNSGLLSHTFTEELNPETKKWEIQDPDLNIFWRAKKDKTRVGVEDLLAHPLDIFEPCHTESDCGYADYFENKARTYMNVVSIRDYDNNRRPLLVNTSRFDLDKPFPINGKNTTFCAYVPKDCKQEIRRYSDDKSLSQ